LAIVDDGIGDNSGFGVGNIFFYEILGGGLAELSNGEIFQRQTIQLRYTLKTDIQCLPPSAHNPEKIMELVERGKVVKFEGWLAFVALSKSESEKLLAAGHDLDNYR